MFKRLFTCILLISCMFIYGQSSDRMELLCTWTDSTGMNLDIGRGGGLDVFGDYVYFCDLGGLRVLHYEEGVLEKVATVKSPFDTTFNEIAVIDGYGFIGSNVYTLLYDLSEPSRPVHIATTRTGNAHIMDIHENMLYLAGGSSIKTLDITNPLMPILRDTSDDCDMLIECCFDVDYPYAYYGGDIDFGSGGFHAFDISDPDNIITLSTVGFGGMGTFCKSVMGNGGHVYSCGGFRTPLMIFDSSYTRLSDWEDVDITSYGMAIKDSFLVVGGFGNIYCLNISNPEDITVAGYYDSEAFSWAFHRIKIVGNNIFAFGVPNSASDGYAIWVLNFEFMPESVKEYNTPKKIDFSISPNPFNSSCNIAIECDTDSKLEISTIDGRIVHTQEISENISNINIPSGVLENSGVYLFKVSNPNSTIYTRAVFLK